jgi:hypothetical protein
MQTSRGWFSTEHFAFIYISELAVMPTLRGDGNGLKHACTDRFSHSIISEGLMPLWTLLFTESRDYLIFAFCFILFSISFSTFSPGSKRSSVRNVSSVKVSGSHNVVL